MTPQPRSNNSSKNSHRMRGRRQRVKNPKFCLSKNIKLNSTKTRAELLTGSGWSSNSTCITRTSWKEKKPVNSKSTWKNSRNSGICSSSKRSTIKLKQAARIQHKFCCLSHASHHKRCSSMITSNSRDRLTHITNLSTSWSPRFRYSR